VSAANGASYATGPQDRASQGSRREAATAEAKRCGLPGHAFAVQKVANEPDVERLQRAVSGHPSTSEVC